MIFMTHPKHGAMHVASPAESIAHQKNGWVESTYAQWLGDKAEAQGAADDPAAVGEPEAEEVSPPALEKKKPGRKPKGA